MGATPAETAAMRRALQIAATPGVPLGPNPRVGCVLLADDGTEVAEGFHRGAGTRTPRSPRSTEAGDDARGATAVVTLEPCNHTGRTGPCVEALLAAGVRRVVFAQADPTRRGRGRRRRAACRRGRGRGRGAGRRGAHGSTGPGPSPSSTVGPFVTWKLATTLDGRSAAADGTSRWISSEPARAGHPPAARRVRRAARRHRHRRGRRPAADRPRRLGPTRCATSRCARSWGCATSPPTAGSSTTTPRRCTCAPASPPRRCATLLRPRPPARLAGGRAHARGRLPHRRPRRRGRRLRRPEPARRRHERGRRPRHHHHRRPAPLPASGRPPSSAPAPTPTSD